MRKGAVVGETCRRRLAGRHAEAAANRTTKPQSTHQLCKRREIRRKYGGRAGRRRNQARRRDPVPLEEKRPVNLSSGARGAAAVIVENVDAASCAVDLRNKKADGMLLTGDAFCCNLQDRKMACKKRACSCWGLALELPARAMKQRCPSESFRRVYPTPIAVATVPAGSSMKGSPSGGAVAAAGSITSRSATSLPF